MGVVGVHGAEGGKIEMALGEMLADGLEGADFGGGEAKPGKARPRLIHRLDRDTSGVILTAKTKPAASFLGKHMMGRRFAKSYRAIVTPGAPEPAGGVIEVALRREEAGWRPICGSVRRIIRTPRLR